MTCRPCGKPLTPPRDVERLAVDSRPEASEEVPQFAALRAKAKGSGAAVRACGQLFERCEMVQSSSLLDLASTVMTITCRIVAKMPWPYRT